MLPVEFDEIKHEYTYNGVKVPSVTQVIAPLYADTAMAANPIQRDLAAKRGTAVHEATAVWDYCGELPDELLDAETLPFIQAYIDWERDYRPKMLYIELPLTDGFYAGTLDRLAEIDGAACVIDIKTGNPDIRAVSAQCYAYGELLWANRIPNVKYYVLQLKKDGKYSFRQLSKQRGGLFWDLCWSLYTAVKEDKERKTKYEY